MTDFHALIHRMADELDHYRQLLTDDRRELHPLATEARAVLAEADGPAVPDDREPASVVDQLKRQLLSKTKANLIREVINQALKDTASVHWRVTDTGEQIVRVGDLLRWADQSAAQMEALPDV